jgi:hypothetical protein
MAVIVRYREDPDPFPNHYRYNGFGFDLSDDFSCPFLHSPVLCSD